MVGGDVRGNGGPELGEGPVGRGRDRGIEVVTRLGVGARPVDVE